MERDSQERVTAAFSEYRIADVPEEDLKRITELEKIISSDTHEDIVLIAYKSSHEK